MWVVDFCVALGRKLLRKWSTYAIVAVSIQVAISIYCWKSGGLTHSLAMRMRFLGLVETLMFIGSCVTWRRMRTLIDLVWPYFEYPTTNDALKTATILFLILSQVSCFLYYYLLGPEPHWFTIVCFSCVGMFINFVSLLLAGEVGINILEWLQSHWHYAGQSFIEFLADRKFLIDRSFQTAIFFIFSVILTAAGLYYAHLPPEIKTITIYIRDLPPSLDGLKIGLLSDFHIGPTVGRTRVEHVANLVNNEVRPGTYVTCVQLTVLFAFLCSDCICIPRLICLSRKWAPKKGVHSIGLQGEGVCSKTIYCKNYSPSNSAG